MRHAGMIWNYLEYMITYWIVLHSVQLLSFKQLDYELKISITW